YATSLYYNLSCFSSMIRPQPRSILFPYTSLFRSLSAGQGSQAVTQGRKVHTFAEKIMWVQVNLSSADQELTCTHIIFSANVWTRSEEHTSELQSRGHLVCRLLLEKKNRK